MTMTEERPTLTADGGDPKVEAWLDSLHITWTFEPAAPIDRIDLAAGLRNQARVTAPLDPEVVERYTTAMAAGDTFPPVLLRRRGRGRHIPLGGNHRLAAAVAAGRTEHPAYLVEVTDEVAPLLMYGDNARHGLPPSRDERIAQAIHLIEACGLTQGNAAAAVGLAQPAVSLAQTVQKASRRAHDLDVGSLFDALPKGHRERLATIGSDPVFSKATKLAKLAGLSQPDTADLVRRVKDARSERTALVIVGQELEDRRGAMQATAAKGGQRRQRQPETAYISLRRQLTLLRVCTPSDIAASCPTTEAASETRKWLKDVTAKLIEVDEALKAKGARR